MRHVHNKILLVEDDRDIVDMVRKYLAKEGFIITAAYDGEEGIEAFHKETFDLLLVDLMMPKLDGMELIKMVREKSSVPILIMSAKDSDIDKALGLGFGADDYIAKPFSMIEITARVKAAIRRATRYSPGAEPPKSNRIVTAGDLTIDLDNFSVVKNKEELKLTSKEFDILRLFVTNPNRVFTKAQIYHLVWNDEYYGDENVINVHMSRLRDKIEDQPSSPKYIKTLWGIGYKWEGG